MKKRIYLFILLIYISINAIAQDCVVASVDFEGAKKASTSFLKNLIHTKQGTKLVTKTLEQDITRLIRLPVIGNASYTIQESQLGCVVKIKIQENFTLIPTADFFQTTDDQVNEIAYTIGLTEHNLFKRSISLGAWYQRNVFDSYSVSLNAPYLFSPKTGLSVSYNNLTTQEPVFFSDGTVNFKYNNESLEVLGLHQFNFKNNLVFGVNVFKEQYDTAIENTIGIEGAKADFSFDKLLFKTIYTHDNLKYFFQYISGFKSQLNLQYVTSDDDRVSNFIIGWNDFLYYKRIKERGNWATRLRLGLSSNSDSPFAPFSVDNNLNVRGVGSQIDRGTGIIALNTEYRYTLKEKDWYVIQTNLFIDTGTWRNPGGDFSDFTDINNVRIFPGAGLRFIHKKIFNLTFRADFGYGIINNDPSGLVFGVGQYF